MTVAARATADRNVFAHLSLRDVALCVSLSYTPRSALPMRPTASLWRDPPLPLQMTRREGMERLPDAWGQRWRTVWARQ